MLASLHIAGDLAGLFLAYMDREGLDLPELRKDMARYDARTRMSYADWWRALESLRDATGKPHIGLEVGTCIEPAYCGVLGYLSLSCDYLGEALARFERFQQLLYGGSEAKAETRGEIMRFTWPVGEEVSTRESDETLVSALVSYSRMLAGDESLNPARVGFIHQAPGDTRPYESLFHCPVDFGCPNVFVEFHHQFLALPTSRGDPALKALLDGQAETLMANLPTQDALLERLAKVLLRAIQDGEPSLESVARALSMSPRTLHRRLEERDIGFKQLLHQTRYRLARQYLADQRLTLGEIAVLLGYSEQSAFSRAFRQWSGMSPLKWQKQQQQTDKNDRQKKTG